MAHAALPRCFRSLLIGALTAALLPAATILVNPSPGTSAPAVIEGITGASMAGLLVTFTYWYPPPPISSGVQVLSGTWVATGPVSGGVSISGNTLRLSGLTSGNQAWQYTPGFLSTLLSIELDGSAAGIYFDRTAPNSGTPGTADIVLSVPFPPRAAQSAIVTYSNAVGVGGNPPQGDLYAKLKIDFSNLGDPGQPGLNPLPFTFTQDTDQAVPEPNAVFLVFAGIAAFYARIRRLS